MQEDHDFPHNLLLCPGSYDPLGRHRANAIDLAEPIGALSMMSNTFSPKAFTIFVT
jgi:hypothetical protein